MLTIETHKGQLNDLTLKLKTAPSTTLSARNRLIQIRNETNQMRQTQLELEKLKKENDEQRMQ